MEHLRELPMIFLFHFVYRSKTWLKYHVMKHLRELPMIFLFHFVYRSKTWLKYHVMKHLDITEFLCDECGEAFAMQKLLRKHVVTMHGSEELR